MTQHIRSSQYITTYGPGAILEGREGPRIVPLPDIGLFEPNNLNINSFEISDPRITQGLLGGARIFRLPSNAELGAAENWYIYRTRAFPTWKLCLTNSQHPAHDVLFRGQECPVCHRRSVDRQGIEAIRFIMACPEGHIDDVNWSRVAHQNYDGTCSHNIWFMWSGGGGALSNIEIRCPVCGAEGNLGDAYSRHWECSGRHPEREPFNINAPVRPGCNASAKMVQRQASNLRLPNLITLFSIPPRSTRLHNLLQTPAIYHGLVATPVVSDRDFRGRVNNLQERRLITGNVAIEICSHEWEEISHAIQDIMNPIPDTYHELILEEFRALRRASYHGAPPVTAPRPRSQVIFEVDPNKVRVFPGTNGARFRVTPILRLRTVTVNTGYRREVDTNTPSTALY